MSRGLYKRHLAEKRKRLEFELSLPIERCYTDADGVFHTEIVNRSESKVWDKAGF